MTVSKAKQDLEHQVWKLIKKHSLQEKKILVALSGGVDSIALLRLLAKVHRKELLAACYFHHGEDSNTVYRDKAHKFCEKICEDWGLKFYFKKSSASVQSEEKYRDLRYAALGQILKSEKFDLLSTAHHRDDLLETRLLRLIRGTGGQGLKSMNILAENLFRPLLEVSKSELEQYLKSEGVRFIKDPSNKSLDPLRNWVREKWLKDLNKKSPGAALALARSLDIIAADLGSGQWGDLLQSQKAVETEGISRSYYLTLNSQEQKRLLAQYLYQLGKRDFFQSHIEEVQKRLDKSQKVVIFKVGGCLWEVNAGQIKVQF